MEDGWGVVRNAEKSQDSVTELLTDSEGGEDGRGHKTAPRAIISYPVETWVSHTS